MPEENTSRDLRLGCRFTVQQENTARATLDWLKTKNPNMLERPNQSQVLSLIANLWHDLKTALHHNDLHPV